MNPLPLLRDTSIIEEEPDRDLLTRAIPKRRSNLSTPPRRIPSFFMLSILTPTIRRALLRASTAIPNWAIKAIPSRRSIGARAK